MQRLLRLLVALYLLTACALQTQADRLDDFVRVQMHQRQISGLSLAVIQDGKIVKAKGYGVTEIGGNSSVTSTTLFQAGSISKSVAAIGALRLVEQGRISLDEDVNARLTTWKVPESDFTKVKKVTLRRILSHNAGLTVHGFPGYGVDAPVPTLEQVLDGTKPANTPAIRVDIIPGSRWRYSGGGYTIMQQMMLDVTHKSFPQLMQETVLGPMGMSHSTYEQPLPGDKARMTATGHYADRSLVKGRWHVYPEMAAAGLWTTASDLTRFAIGVQNALAGKSNSVISQSMARQMVSDQNDNDGLGVFLEGSGKTLRFSHNGRDEGFDAMLMAYAETGQGAAIVINANDNSRMIPRILEYIAREYHWPDFPVHSPPKGAPVRIDPRLLDTYSGRYEFANNRMTNFAVLKGKLFSVSDGFPDEELLPKGEDRFVFAEHEGQITFTKDSQGRVNGCKWVQGNSRGNAPRIGPLVHSLKPAPDPDLARTRRVEEALSALADGKASTVADKITTGAQRDFGGGPLQDLAGLRSVTYLSEEDTSDRAIERHGGKVARILYFKMRTDILPRYLLVYLTAESKLTDLDSVTD